MEAKKQHKAGKGSKQAVKQAVKSEDKVGPFFVLGCVRSGTTMLRDVLRLHPNLAAPEETHLFRWSEPFGTDGYIRGVTSNPVLKRHRTLDGITEEEFAAMLRQSNSRADLYARYMKLYIERRKPHATRWFDKTPQNVYGAAMIASSVPHSRFVHIVRDPVNVVASLRIGKVMKIDRLLGAVNYWREAVDIIAVLKRASPRRVHELRYEDFVREPAHEIKRLLTFLGERYDAAWFKDYRVRESDHADAGVLSAEEVEQIHRLAIGGRKRYGYAAPDEAGDEDAEDSSGERLPSGHLDIESADQAAT
jgi:hypothetical protein